jgi:hypothetical protein
MPRFSRITRALDCSKGCCAQVTAFKLNFDSGKSIAAHDYQKSPAPDQFDRMLARLYGPAARCKPKNDDLGVKQKTFARCEVFAC